MDAVGADEELAGAGADVPGGGQDRLGRPHQLGVLRLGEERGGGLLDELLVAALQGAVAGGDHDHGAVGVGQALGLHVARVVQEPFDEALAAPERGDGLAHRGLEQLGDLLEGARDLQAAPAAAVRGLDRHRQPVLARRRPRPRRALHGVGGARHQRRVRGQGDVAGLDLVAEGVDGLGAGPDPGEPGVDDLLRERPRSRRGTRTRGAPRPPPPPSRPRSACPPAGTSRPASSHPARTPRRPPARATRHGPARRTPPPNATPWSRHARAMRTAISPRLAMRTLVMAMGPDSSVRRGADRVAGVRPRHTPGRPPHPPRYGRGHG